MTRDRRRRDRNYTGILRGNRARTEQPEVSQIEDRRKFNWRMVSGFMVLALSGILALFFYADVFYVHTIAVGGVRYMTKEEVFAYADIANTHIFWVQPEVVRERLLGFQTVADAEVRISWPPNMVNIVVEEREPALVWEQNGVAIWVDIQGNVMRQYEDRPGLLRIVAENI